MKKQPTARAGKKLGRYRIERELGRGGMGVVYLAADENLGRLVALKTTAVAGLGGGNNARTQRRQRFIREVQALSNVNHPNVVHVFDSGEEDDPDLGWLLFYSMEHVDGLTLAQLVQTRGALQPGAAAAVCMQVAAGLGAAHERGIVHRDVKPANIFVSHDGRALIGDFGICKIEGSTQITRRDQLVGTPNYLAPEQILGEDVGPATDVFALGALFYVIAVNRPLRDRVDASSLLKSSQGDEPVQKIMGERGIPEGLRRVVARALERDPKKRWANGHAFAEALSEHATRIPSLTGEDEEEGFLRDMSSSDTSSPFASLPKPAPASVFDVEAAARALLSEVEEDEAANAALSAASSGGQPQGRGPIQGVKLEPLLAAPPALPVARTESTVMFNLRTMETKNKPPPPPAPATSAPVALPVARTESTVVFKMRANEGRAQPSLAAPTLAPDVEDDPAEGFGDENTLPGESTVDAAVPPPPRQRSGTPAAAYREDAIVQPVVRTVAPPPSRSAEHFDWRKWIAAVPPEKRTLLFAVVVVGGALAGALVLGLAMLLFGRAPAPPAPAPTAFELPTLPIVSDAPAECSNGAKNDEDRVQARFKVGKALRAKAERRSDAIDLLNEALALDPRNVQGHYERAQARAALDDRKGAIVSYTCVCAIDPASTECRGSTKALLKMKQAEMLAAPKP